MARRKIEFPDPTGLEFDEEEWIVHDEIGDFTYYRRDKWDLKIVLTERFNPIGGDQLTFRNGGKVEFLANDADTFWVRTVPDGTYLTCHKTTFKESDDA